MSVPDDDPLERPDAAEALAVLGCDSIARIFFGSFSVPFSVNFSVHFLFTEMDFWALFQALFGPFLNDIE